MARSDTWQGVGGIALVLALHGAALHVLLSHRILPVPDEVVTLFVDTVTLQPPLPPKQAPRPQPQQRRQPEPQPSRQLVAQAPMVSAAEPVAEAPPPVPVAEAPPPRPAGPVALGGELSVSCPERTPPRYPPLSRRLGEEGKVVLRVELDAHGGVSLAQVATASGFARLDEAALAAVKTWRCTPLLRDGRPVRAVALQPFVFVLQ